MLSLSLSPFCRKAVDVETIDEINILEATMQAMELAVSGLKGGADFVLVDGNRLPKGLPLTTSRAITKGDAKVYAIAAASIIAKVTRDRMMLDLHRQYPQYAFDVHKGYGTAKHTAAIKQHGPCPAHRRTFNPVKTWFFPVDEQEVVKSKKPATKGKPKKNWE
jgi:ribonuclease HII